MAPRHDNQHSINLRMIEDHSVTNSGLLSGLVVVDCSLWLPGRLCSSNLVSLGAEVTSVLPPTGDPMHTTIQLCVLARHRKGAGKHRPEER